MTWPIGMGKRFKGVYHIYNDAVHIFTPNHGGKVAEGTIIEGLDNPQLDVLVGDQADELREEIELVKGASHLFNLDEYLQGNQTPVFFGSAINNFGIKELLDAFAEYAPMPQSRQSIQRTVESSEKDFTESSSG